MTRSTPSGRITRWSQTKRADGSANDSAMISLTRGRLGMHRLFDIILHGRTKSSGCVRISLRFSDQVTLLFTRSHSQLPHAAICCACASWTGFQKLLFSFAGAQVFPCQIRPSASGPRSAQCLCFKDSASALPLGYKTSRSNFCGWGNDQKTLTSK